MTVDGTSIESLFLQQSSRQKLLVRSGEGGVKCGLFSLVLALHLAIMS